ncbi:MAG: hypothetical protein MPJ25_15615 [Pirellulales bacterium]|nr:hypothetical protein [Pirellulales bacterium]
MTAAKESANDLVGSIKDSFEIQNETLKKAIDDSLTGDAGKQLSESIMQGIAQGIPAGKEFGIKMLADHQPCGADGCELCKIRGEISSAGFRRGVNDGIRLAKKFPELEAER